MKPFKLFCIAIAGMSAAAQAAVATRNSLDFPVGTDVSTVWPGVTLTLLTTGPGTTYAPVMNPVIVGACSYGACASSSPLNSMGGTLFNLLHYRYCYNATLAGFSSSECRQPYGVLEAAFSHPTDFVEFNTAWNFDAPAIIAYDAAGNEIQMCAPGFPVGSTTGCLTAVEFPGPEHFGVIRVATSAPIIARVVLGTPLGNSVALSMQYTVKPKNCNPREPLEKESPSLSE